MVAVMLVIAIAATTTIIIMHFVTILHCSRV
jgi:hypothetical protein